ncbi:MAG TPA: hybrid sensor histidine kinase/response regulator [Candidatus Limnocylindria bacterium]|jgi:two-component system sensor histidine kinase/response regulator|nr:hybrid sensor histidine kinase/response regulator [Candidatus Limnocylindria bacterium]
MGSSTITSDMVQGRRLLIVDDQPANVQMIGSMLAQLGVEIIPATDGPTALKRMQLRPPDLVLLDLMMPDMDGFEVCRRIREQPVFADIPIIFLSAADEKSLVVRALEAGGVDYITKPFNQAELLLRVRTHLTLKATRDRLRQLAEDKDELLGILAHDLRNAIGSVHMTAQVLSRKAGQIADPRLQTLSDNIHGATSRTLAFLKEFLANAAADRVMTLRREPVSLRDLAVQLLKQHQEAAQRKNLSLELEAGPDEVLADADPTALRQVVDNLLSNAIKFSPIGKKIRVTIRSNGGSTDLIVKDEGPGFTPEDKEKMFFRYRRLSARPTDGEPSTGLGLSIVKRLVDAMQGEIICDSTPGSGTVFIVRLPQNTNSEVHSSRPGTSQDEPGALAANEDKHA